MFSFWIYGVSKVDEDDNLMERRYITKHFDFKIDGDIDGVDRQGEDRSYSSQDFGYAYFRDDLKGQENCNPDIND